MKPYELELSGVGKHIGGLILEHRERGQNMILKRQSYPGQVEFVAYEHRAGLVTTDFKYRYSFAGDKDKWDTVLLQKMTAFDAELCNRLMQHDPVSRMYEVVCVEDHINYRVVLKGDSTVMGQQRQGYDTWVKLKDPLVELMERGKV